MTDKVEFRKEFTFHSFALGHPMIIVLACRLCYLDEARKRLRFGQTTLIGCVVCFAAETFKFLYDFVKI
jgi:hypothetical protein